MQTKPLRSFGIDVTQTSMQPILDELGIERSVKQLSQAEKEILRYITTLRQGQVAMGDFANTVESPSNQLKVLRQQLIEAKVAFTNLFIGTFANILPYANALLMVIKEVSKAIADMFGIKISDYNSGIASQEDAYLDLGDSIDDATGKVKELKRQTLGFDEIHNINENQDSGSGSSAITGGIDQRLLDAIKGYDNGMEKVRMKATEIRDRIMEWLGFTKEIDPLTGEVSFKYKGMKTTLKNMWNSFKGLSTEGKILVGLGLTAGALKLWNTGKKLINTFGNGGLLGLIKKFFSPMKSLYNSLDNVNYANKSLSNGLSEGINNWSKSLTMVDKFKVSLVGIIGLSTSMQGMANAMKSVSNEGWNLGNSLQAVVSGIGGIASGAYIGSIFGTWGAVIGGATGAVLELISALNGYDSASKTANKNIEEYEKALSRLDETTKNKLNTDIVQLDHMDKLINELGKLTDANGKVKDGYEDRVNYILNELNQAFGTEYSLSDGLITKNGEVIKSYKQIEAELEETIKWKKAEAVAEAYKEDYINALKNEKELQEKLNGANEEYSQKLDELTEKYGEQGLAILMNEKLSNSQKATLLRNNEFIIESDYAVIKNRQDGLKLIKKEYKENEKVINDYEKLQENILSKNWDNTLKSLDHYIDTSKLKKDEFEKDVKESAKVLTDKLANIFKNIPSTKTTKLNVEADLSRAKNSLNNWLDSLKSVINFSSIFKSTGGSFYNGSWHNIQQYANGGAPSHGTLFWAGERGAEIVAHANGRTEVLNQSQIASTIYSAMVGAMSQYSGGGVAEINVHASKDVIVETAINGINQKTRQTGVCPVDIPMK